MALEQLRIHEIVKQAVSKNLDVPESQRPFVWDPEQVKLLAESLYRDYPIGSFLLWDSSEYQEAKTAKGAQASLWIVDGQQRTTALCLLLEMKPYWWENATTWNRCLERYDPMVNLLPENGDERLEFALPNPIRRADPRWVSVRHVVSVEKVEGLTPLAQEVVKRLTADLDQMMPLFGKIHGRMQRLWQIREADIPIVKVQHEVEDVAEIFSRLNREGTRVKEADVTLALAAVRNPGWVRDEYMVYRNDLEDRGWDLDAGIYIRTMTAIGHGRARLIEVPAAFWGPENLPSAWDKAKTVISEVLKRLAEFGILSPDLLPSTNSLIPLFALHYHWSATAGYSFKRALRWFLLANRDGRYSGSAITSLNEDVRAVADASDFDSALQSLEKRLRVSPIIVDEEFLNRYDRAGNRFLRMMVYLVMYERGAADWVDGSRLGYDTTGNPIATGFAPQWHHIYPRSILAAQNVPIDDIHALANITVLNERTNMNRISNKTPAKYIQQFGITPQTLEDHLVPPSFARTRRDPAFLEQVWSLPRYADLLIERASLLAAASTRYIERLGVT